MSKAKKTTTKAARTTTAKAPKVKASGKGKKVVTPPAAKAPAAVPVSRFRGMIDNVRSRVNGAIATASACLAFIVGLGMKAAITAVLVVAALGGLALVLDVSTARAHAEKASSAAEKAEAEARRMADATVAATTPKPSVLTRVSNWDKGAREYVFGSAGKKAPVVEAKPEGVKAELKVEVKAPAPNATASK